MATKKWVIDPSHSEISFKVKHLMISSVTGYFRKFEGHAQASDDFKKVDEVEFHAYVDSVDTNNEERDTHLKSDDFFNAEKHPKLSFKATEVDVESGKVTGDLSIRDVTDKVTMDLNFGGVVEDPYGQTKAGVTVSGKVKRKNFHLKWNAVTEAGNVVVSDDVKINAEVQFVKQD